MILVVATERDEHARAVIAEIAAAGGRASVLDLSEIPQARHLTVRYRAGERRFSIARQSWNGSAGEAIDLDECRAIWWRRPQTPAISDAIDRPSHRLFAMNETQEALAGLWHALDAFWVNDPARDVLAHRKVYQLRVAQDVGLTIPETLITSDPDAGKAFVAARSGRPTVYKAFSALEEEWRETRLLGEQELSLLDNVAYAPVIFQEYIEATYDLRVTVVGGEVFAAAIHSQQTSYKVDFRMDIANARIAPVDLPVAAASGLRALMERLGLVYGAIDMRLTPDGRYVFLEINPAGQWLFIEMQTGQPIAAAMARLLMEHDRDAVAAGRAPAVADAVRG